MIEKCFSMLAKCGQGVQASAIKLMAMMEINREGMRKYKITLLVFFFCLFYLSFLLFLDEISSGEFENIFISISKVVLVGFFGGNAVENLSSIIIGKHKNSKEGEENKGRQVLMEGSRDIGE